MLVSSSAFGLKPLISSYNLWILADILLWLALFGVVKENPLVTSKLFGTILYTIDPDSGE